MKMEGIWVPIITPFRNGEIDFPSLDNLVERLLAKGVSGIIAGATTGESLSLRDSELFELVAHIKSRVAGRVPVLAGAGGSNTRKTIELIEKLELAGAEGILSASPYFTRPDQRGILAHFKALAESTSLPIIIYNIPYRTGVNIQNATVRELAKIENIIGLKDCSGDFRQSMDLIIDPPSNFSVLTGEDGLLYPMLSLGASGAILATAHWAAESFVQIWQALLRNDHRSGLSGWAKISSTIPLFFEEASPAPIKYWLAKAGVIESGAVRLPLVEPSERLKARLCSISEG